MSKHDHTSFLDFLKFDVEYLSRHFLVMPNFSYHIDKQLYADDLTLENIRALSLLEPFPLQRWTNTPDSYNNLKRYLPKNQLNNLCFYSQKQ